MSLFRGLRQRYRLWRLGIDRCHVYANGSVFHKWACDFGPDCPRPASGSGHEPL